MEKKKESEEVLKQLEKRLGRIHARQRLGIESDFEAKVFGHGLNFFHLENWYSVHSVIKNGLRLMGLYRRGKKNALDIQIKHNDIYLPGLPKAFDGFTILHASDLHVDMNWEATRIMTECMKTLDYDICVLTGDYRAKTFGEYHESLAGMRQIRAALNNPVYAILGNHDTIQMVPGLEEMDIQLLLNESVTIEKEDSLIHLVGIDDAHYYRVDNIEKAVEGIPHRDFSILLSHTPEIYQQAAHAEFNLMLCGHTHGGQLCLPGGFPLTLDANCPRYLGAGPWQYHGMTGYTSAGCGTSVVSVRLNCPPEITLHRLRIV
ncbi:MAG: metallophosphoesterase [Methylococcales bacterium]